jgi:uncharacterized protein (DUF1778 family)
MAQVAERPATRNQTIHIRASQHQRNLIDQAAKVRGKSRSEFILDAACREAEDAILDQTLFYLDPEMFDRFNAMLDEPTQPSEEVRKLMKLKPPWE